MQYKKVKKQVKLTESTRWDLATFGIIDFFLQHEEEIKCPSTARNWEQESAFVDKYNNVAKMCIYCIL